MRLDSAAKGVGRERTPRVRGGSNRACRCCTEPIGPFIQCQPAGQRAVDLADAPELGMGMTLDERTGALMPVGPTLAAEFVELAERTAGAANTVSGLFCHVAQARLGECRITHDR